MKNIKLFENFGSEKKWRFVNPDEYSDDFLPFTNREIQVLANNSVYEEIVEDCPVCRGHKYNGDCILCGGDGFHKYIKTYKIRDGYYLIDIYIPFINNINGGTFLIDGFSTFLNYLKFVYCIFNDERIPIELKKLVDPNFIKLFRHDAEIDTSK